jgi:hypothetical protein
MLDLPHSNGIYAIENGHDSISNQPRIGEPNTYTISAFGWLRTALQRT